MNQFLPCEETINFWNKQGQKLNWFEKPSSVANYNNEKKQIDWFQGGKINASYNALDRHLEKNPQNAKQILFNYQSEDEKVRLTINLEDLFSLVNYYSFRFKEFSLKKGDRIVFYMPLGIEVVAAMLASARLGLIHNCVFAGFSAQALSLRIKDSSAKVIMTADSMQRGGKKIDLYSITTEAIDLMGNDSPLQKVLVVKHSLEANLELKNSHEWIENYSEHPRNQFFTSPEIMDSNDPLFILYTSGSTGKPKGLIHSTGGYLTHLNYTFPLVFDYKANETYWCTADVGWITGHSYIVYGPLLNQAKQILYEGAPQYPAWDRFWKMIDEYQVNIFYTAPTAIRAFMAQGEKWIKPYKLDSLRILGSVGEPINPEAHHFYDEKIGKKKCFIIDTWWQTETGGVLMTPLPHVHKNPKPGLAMGPIPPIKIALMNDQGKEIEGEGTGALVIKEAWPSLAKSIYLDHPRFLSTYFETYPGYYFTGDGAYRDKDGDIRVIGRIDDVINISGHRLGTAEVESALITHLSVGEASAIGVFDEIKGENLFCFVAPRLNVEAKDFSQLESELYDQVSKEIGKFARPKKILIVKELPKTRSGKIMRRILKKMAEGEREIVKFGDLSTLANPNAVDDIILLMNERI